MKRKNSGYLLLECMIAMVVIVTSLLFLISTITFLLLDEKKAQDELEVAILLYEMTSLTQETQRQSVEEKANQKGMHISAWTNNNLRIEREEICLEINKQ
ncbi:MAG: hypothetical protein RR554_03425 [Vagococcus sp.]|uniref:hypothetical protein n=1 Tax=Vagococcus sp. TaxID=1933889 RepID=UPI002FC9A329